MGDLNHLLYSEQEALLRAQYCACPDARAALRRRANGYADRIRDHRLSYRSLAMATGRTAFDPFPYGAKGNRP